jgi:hypothetical protein
MRAYQASVSRSLRAQAPPRARATDWRRVVSQHLPSDVCVAGGSGLHDTFLRSVAPAQVQSCQHDPAALLSATGQKRGFVVKNGICDRIAATKPLRKGPGRVLGQLKASSRLRRRAKSPEQLSDCRAAVDEFNRPAIGTVVLITRIDAEGVVDRLEQVRHEHWPIGHV